MQPRQAGLDVGRRLTSKKRIVILSQEIDPHADTMVGVLKDRGIRPVRFHTKDFPSAVRLTIRSARDGAEEIIISSDDWTIAGDEILSVWNRRPDTPAIDSSLSPEEARMALAECHASLVGFYRICPGLWVNHPDKNRVANSKSLQQQAAKTLGLKVADTLLTNDPAEARRFYEAHGGNIIFKLQRASLWSEEKALSIYTARVKPAQLEKLDLLRHAPGYFQEYIEKRLELRVTIVGSRIFSAALHSQEIPAGRIDWRKATEQIRHEVYELPTEIEKALLGLMAHFGLHYGAIDMIVTPQGEHIFLEINPNGQFGWIDQATGLPIYQALADLLMTGKAA